MTTFERFPDDRDGPQDECGVFGVYAPGHDVSRLAYFSLYALQHAPIELAGRVDPRLSDLTSIALDQVADQAARAFHHSAALARSQLLWQLAMFCAVGVLATCSVDAVTFIQPKEDCETMGDEDGNGTADYQRLYQLQLRGQEERKIA